jgi:hypothetical protein
LSEQLVKVTIVAPTNNAASTLIVVTFFILVYLNV